MPDIEKTENREGTKEIPKYKLVCVSLGAEVQDLVYFLAHGSVNLTIHQQLVPNDWKELALLHLGQITIPDTDTDTDNKKRAPVKAIAPPKKKPDVQVIERKRVAPKPKPEPKPEIWDDAMQSMPPASVKPMAGDADKGYEFVREKAVPYKPWTLIIGGETYHLNKGQKAIMAFILDAGLPKSKTQMKDFCAAFNIPAMKKLKEMGILHTYSQKNGNKRSVFYGVETDGYRPQYDVC